jgi:penicillin-binding protein A
VNRQIRRLGVVLIAAYVVLFAQLNLVQVLRADDYLDNPANTRQVQRAYNRDRGFIVSADDQVVAETVVLSSDEAPDDRFTRERRYPLGDLMAPLTGYFSFEFGATGVESTYNDELEGSTFGQQLSGWRDVFVDRSPVGDVRLSVDAGLQRVAAEALGNRDGSVVVIDPRTGQVLALWSSPSFDPNTLSTTNLDDARQARAALLADAGNPLLNHSYQENYFPGSTFKVVTAASGLRQDKVAAASPVYPVETQWVPPQTTRPITNFDNSSCGGALVEILRVSCNTAFSRMGVETVGPEDMITGAEAFGFNAAVPIDLPDPAESVFPTLFTQDLPRLAQASIGQNDVLATPLQMALVAGAIGNGGRMMAPTVVREVTDRSGRVVQRTSPRVWLTPLAPASNQILRDAMVTVVERGTASVLTTDGVQVGGKTGTAQLGTDPPRQHTWIMAFAGPPGEAHVALAVVVLNQTGGGATGSSIAGPVARTVLDAALALPPRQGR